MVSSSMGLKDIRKKLATDMTALRDQVERDSMDMQLEIMKAQQKMYEEQVKQQVNQQMYNGGAMGQAGGGMAQGLAPGFSPSTFTAMEMQDLYGGNVMTGSYPKPVPKPIDSLTHALEELL